MGKAIEKAFLGLTALILSFMMHACPARAQELVLEPWVTALGTEAPPAALMGDEAPLELDAGVKTPHEGVLMTRGMAARWAARLDWYRAQLVQDTTTLRAMLVAEVGYRVKLAAVELQSKDRELKGCEDDLRLQATAFTKASNPPFYKKPAFAYTIGVTLGVVLSTVVTVVAKRAER